MPTEEVTGTDFELAKMTDIDFELKKVIIATIRKINKFGYSAVIENSFLQFVVMFQDFVIQVDQILQVNHPESNYPNLSDYRQAS